MGDKIEDSVTLQKIKKRLKTQCIYPFASIFLDVDWFNEGFHVSEKIFDAHFPGRLLFFFLLFSVILISWIEKTAGRRPSVAEATTVIVCIRREE